MANHDAWACMRLRKPLAVFAITFSSCIVLWYVVIERQDMPDGVVSILQAQLACCVGGYMGTSAYEAVRNSAPNMDDERR